MSPKSSSQILVFPEHADYIYMDRVDVSEAHYVRQVIEFRGINKDENFIVLDSKGQQVLLERKPLKHMGFAHAWQAVYQ